MNTTLFPDLVVNGETVPHHLIAAEAQNHEAPKGKPGIAWRKAAKAITMRTLMLQEAQRRGITTLPEEIGPGRFETDEEALIRGLLEQAVEVAPPGDAEIRAEWARDPARFKAPPLWEVSHILCACDPRDEEARNHAERRAGELTREALATPKHFARLASEHSDCGSKSSGGALGQLGPGDTVPEFEAVLRVLAEGEITTEPVLSRHGWHVIRMDACAAGSELPYEAVREQIAQALEKAAWTKAAKAFAQTLVASAEISGVDMDGTLEEEYP
ncbi:peptidylprolyl isomerase [Celeribacter neptunius]|uniref:Parvulin-like PPIase n=1 Tax=Celeribacter neptunius TaxID=588602 RepID=A0A1I3R3T1_9RHOB|nr:peptidylprolyl isomerase [Celeribacter neptunius]SFJ41018.1 peptidyl-prolyl cis-trans isomerase C [Celeribacter neptunius]